MLFTMTATFSDFTFACEQYETEEPSAALAAFILNAHALGNYDPKSRAIAARIGGYELIHVADGMRGLWTWWLKIQLKHEEVELYGGCIVQTDPASPTRATGTA